MKLPLILGGLLLMGSGYCDSDSCDFFPGSASQSTYQEPSQQTDLATPSIAYQAPTAGDSKPVGFIMPPIVRGECRTGVAARYDPNKNTIYLCEDLPPALKRYVISHEVAHAVDFQQDRKFELDAEYWADQYAVNSLLQKADCEAVGAWAAGSLNIKKNYVKGVLYAREMHSIHCR